MLGEDHPDTATPLNDLAVLDWGQRRGPGAQRQGR